MKKTSLCYTVAALAVVALAPLEAADKNKAWTDPAAAKKEDPDFFVPYCPEHVSESYPQTMLLHGTSN